MAENRRREDELLDSNYDGIQEYDNDLPRWWVYLFYITIIFGAIYGVYMHMMRSETSEQIAVRTAHEISGAGAQNAATTAVVNVDDEGRLQGLVSNNVLRDQGKAVFTARCAPCHGPDGGGLIGPNLTDKNWIHGGKLAEIKSVIEKGVPEKGMLAWKGTLKADEIDALVVFIRSLQGTTPANPKAPEGVPVG